MEKSKVVIGYDSGMGGAMLTWQDIAAQGKD
jgi:hypothetical protein